MKHAVVTGAYQGLGARIANELEAVGYKVHRWDLRFEQSVDLCSEGSVAAAVHRLPVSHIHALVNCAGVNTLASVDELTSQSWDHHMAVNARGMLYTVQQLIPHLSAGGSVCNIISNASHMPMRMSLAYNASKAAAAMLTRQMARELWGTHRITVFGVSPNRLHGTPMSVEVDKQVAVVRGWTMEQVRANQLAALPIGEETDPAAVAEFIGWLLSTKERHRYLHGAILDYGI